MCVFLVSWNILMKCIFLTTKVKAEETCQDEWLEFKSAADFSPKDWPANRNFQSEQGVAEYEFLKLGKKDYEPEASYAVVWDLQGVCEVDTTEVPVGLLTVRVQTTGFSEIPIRDYATLISGATVLHLMDGPPALMADSLDLKAERKVIHGYTCGRAHNDRRHLYSQDWEFLVSPPGLHHAKPILSRRIMWPLLTGRKSGLGPNQSQTNAASDPIKGEALVTLTMRVVTLPAAGLSLSLSVQGKRHVELVVIDLCSEGESEARRSVVCATANGSRPRTTNPQDCQRFQAKSTSGVTVPLSAPTPVTRCELFDGTVLSGDQASAEACHSLVAACSWTLSLSRDVIFDSIRVDMRDRPSSA